MTATQPWFDQQSYVELLETVWDGVYSQGSSPAAEPLLRYERARRRTAVLRTLSAVMPATAILHVGLSADRSLDPFLSSAYWRQRPAEPGSAFPPSGSTAAAFASFLRAQWLPEVDPWVADIVGYELAVLWGAPLAGGGERVRRYSARWADGVRIAACGFDVAEYVPQLRRACGEMPWDMAALTVLPRPRAFATVSFPAGGRMRRFHVRDETWRALARLAGIAVAGTDCAAELPPGDDAIVEKALKLGVLVREAAGVVS